MSEPVYFNFPALVEGIRQNWHVTHELERASYPLMLTLSKVSSTLPSIIDYKLVNDEQVRDMQLLNEQIAGFNNALAIASIAHQNIAQAFDALVRGMQAAQQMHVRAMGGPSGTA